MMTIVVVYCTHCTIIAIVYSTDKNIFDDVNVSSSLCSLLNVIYSAVSYTTDIFSSCQEYTIFRSIMIMLGRSVQA